MTDSVLHSISENTRILSQILSDIIEFNYLNDHKKNKLSKTQFSILKILKFSGSQQVSEIARILQISRPAASKNIENLVQDKLVDREILKKDRRGAIVHLTNRGERLVDEFESLRESRQKAALAGFTKSEKKQLSELLSRYVRQCIEQENSFELICLRCNGRFLEQCSAGDKRKNCRYYHKSL